MHWIEIVQAGFVVLIGVAATFIAGLQWWNAKERNKLDLFDKRYAVYQAGLDLIGMIQTKALNIEPQEVNLFRLRTLPREVLFGQEVDEFFDGLLYDAERIFSLKYEIENSEDEEQRRRAARAYTELIQSMNVKRAELKRLCHPDLTVRPTPWGR